MHGLGAESTNQDFTIDNMGDPFEVMEQLKRGKQQEKDPHCFDAQTDNSSLAEFQAGVLEQCERSTPPAIKTSSN